MEKALNAEHPDHLTFVQILQRLPDVEASRLRPAIELCAGREGLEAVTVLIGGRATRAYPAAIVEPVAKELRVPFGDEQPSA
ncbi:MAG TPA: hypothetical protein VFI74_03295 [Candidatus Saccharimonadales bacterium]|nr:hypothetical protein [Candidatus Saccharimonadales bacterium]